LCGGRLSCREKEMQSKKICYVIMPFSETKEDHTEKYWEDTYKLLLKPAVEDSGFGYICERSQAKRENIMKSIVRSLFEAHTVVADLTDGKCNVLYELGIRHALRTRTILVARELNDIPSDLRAYPSAFYGNQSLEDVSRFRNKIKELLLDIENNPDLLDNPVADFIRDVNKDVASFRKLENLNKLSALLSELSFNISHIEIMTKGLEHSSKSRAAGKGRKFSIAYLENSSLKLLLSTSYVGLSKEILETLWHLDEEITAINKICLLWPQPNFAAQAEKQLSEHLPTIKTDMASIMSIISRIRNEYNRGIFQEAVNSPIIVAKIEHKEFLTST
jgi:hypothetical protein